MAFFQRKKFFEKRLTNANKYDKILRYFGAVMLAEKYADMAELADALASGASRGNPVQVQLLLSALKRSFVFRRIFLFCLNEDQNLT